MAKVNPLNGKGASMRRVRESRNLSEQDVAYAMGCSTNELMLMENGSIEEGSTYIAKMLKWSEKVGISLSVFLEGEWTPADDQLLFHIKRDEVKDNALERLSKLNPPPSITECRGVLAQIQDKFQKYWDESRTNVVAWRTKGFSVDDFELRQMLQVSKIGNAAPN